MRYNNYGAEIPDNTELYRLIDAMVLDIQNLEAEIVRLRRRLAICLPDERFTDFFSGLAGFYAEHHAYYEYIKNAHNGVDPLGEAHAMALDKILNP
jgi:hypothetical protein